MSMKQLYLLSVLTPFSLFAPTQPETIIVLAPYADPRSPGRTINGQYERGIALQCAERLKTALATMIPNSHVIITPPEHDPLATAAFANSMQPTLFCALSLYQEKSPKPCVNLYRYTRESDLPLQKTELAFVPYDEVYRLCVPETKSLLKNLYEHLSTEQGLTCVSPCALPIQTVLGIAAPAISIEIGIPHDYDWSLLVQPLTAGIAHAV